MALKTFTPPVGPSPGTAFEPQIKVLEAEFGDGYSQPTPDGINNVREKVKLNWDGLTEREMSAINAFFMARKGAEAFYFKPAGYDRPLKWTCKEWGRTLTDGVWKMTATFVQSFTAQI
ncbi:phage tail protein [Shinella zoogloeoides]|uniref:phage tail protein n=1 Tax=Shinella zoogloeoides TaxID=352475 RepID=UPI00273E01D8|nr:phage tail protein [Shinella zoogloeoides]WLR91005.1 phage tail protein [Shinella zoogloeoides]